MDKIIGQTPLIEKIIRKDVSCHVFVNESQTKAVY